MSEAAERCTHRLAWVSLAPAPARLVRLGVLYVGRKYCLSCGQVLETWNQAAGDSGD